MSKVIIMIIRLSIFLIHLNVKHPTRLSTNTNPFHNPTRFITTFLLHISVGREAVPSIRWPSRHRPGGRRDGREASTGRATGTHVYLLDQGATLAHSHRRPLLLQPPRRGRQLLQETAGGGPKSVAGETAVWQCRVHKGAEGRVPARFWEQPSSPMRGNQEGELRGMARPGAAPRHPDPHQQVDQDQSQLRQNWQRHQIAIP